MLNYNDSTVAMVSSFWDASTLIIDSTCVKKRDVNREVPKM